jgi:hypothetical protein
MLKDIASRKSLEQVSEAFKGVLTLLTCEEPVMKNDKCYYHPLSWYLCTE